MAQLYDGMTCAICEKVLDIKGLMVATTHFITDPNDPLWAYSDAAMHYSCFQAWEHREEYINRYNNTIGQRVWRNKTRLHMRADGLIESILVDGE